MWPLTPFCRLYTHINIYPTLSLLWYIASEPGCWGRWMTGQTENQDSEGELTVAWLVVVSLADRSNVDYITLSHSDLLFSADPQPTY
ncbi:hypothetical protein BC629DRAFT_1522068 [Irpex lacteus]|nr:hypothetical protein BC629DRAFT_1522068 [Irpex lacteus]